MLVQETLESVSSCYMVVSSLWLSSVVEAVVASGYFDVMWLILKSPARGLYLSKGVSGFSVTNESNELTGSEGSTESSFVDIYISVWT